MKPQEPARFCGARHKQNTANTKTRKGSEDVWRKQRSVTQMLVLVGSALRAAPEWLQRWMPDWRPRSRRAAEKFLALGPLGPPEKFGAYRAEDGKGMQGVQLEHNQTNPNDTKCTVTLISCFIVSSTRIRCDSFVALKHPLTTGGDWWLAVSRPLQ
jgi:hypothetical protein